jgi:RNA polymerase sigma-70 factor (ECF subfamily)
VVEAFVAAFEGADVARMVQLLTADVRFTMPPLPAWFDGRDAVATFYAERVFAMRWRQVRIADVNGQPAVLGYSELDGEPRPGALQVLSFRDGRISWVASFLDPALWSRLKVIDADR